MENDIKDISKRSISVDNTSFEAISAGCLQRIALALEAKVKQEEQRDKTVQTAIKILADVSWRYSEQHRRKMMIQSYTRDFFCRPMRFWRSLRSLIRRIRREEI